MFHKQDIRSYFGVKKKVYGVLALLRESLSQNWVGQFGPTFTLRKEGREGGQGDRESFKIQSRRGGQRRRRREEDGVTSNCLVDQS